MLDRSATINEGYQTAHVVIADGRIVSGILQQQTATHVSIRDAKDKLHTIPVEDVDEIEPSQLSVMPTGLTEILNRDELVDLVRYLSSLGRETR
jgi:putative heme-binding domain-containing protein